MTVDPTGPVEGAAFSGSTGTPSRRRVGLVLAGATILIIGAAATSWAASPAPSSSGAPSNGGSQAMPAVPGNGPADAPDFGRFGRPGFGFREITIASINGNDVTLKTDDGWTRTITISDGVTLTKGGQPIDVSDLKVGDQVRFRQTRNDDGSYTVTAVAIVVPTIRGTASDITSSGFKVTTRDGSVWTVTVNGSTVYRVGQANGSLADVKDGGRVVVAGENTGDNRMTASTVAVAGDRAVGKVTAKTPDTITIQTRDGKSVTVHVSADTTYRVAGVENAKLDDVAVGMAVGVSGRARSDGSIDAATVVAGRLGAIGRRFDLGKGFGRGGGLPDAPDAGPPGAAEPAIDLELGIPTA
ncbi:MAG TPA: DUF5666 domain-containing protein [Candidatus Limnocylindrales bacterium]|nr:DUF5666 domain-containing protein [Candidatus Limnocylindrales bacterium]